MFRLFRLRAKNTLEEKFWNWFQNNLTDIEAFIDSDLKDYSVYNLLSKKIKKYNKNLFPELTKNKENKYILIITPDGMKEGVEATKKLGESHPDFDNWEIKKFRQPTDKILLNINGLKYPASDIKILPKVDYEREKVDIQVFINNMKKDEKKYQHLAFLYFDHILGEFNTIMKVGYFGFFT